MHLPTAREAEHAHVPMARLWEVKLIPSRRALGLMVSGDQQELRRVLHNLLELKYSESARQHDAWKPVKFEPL